jgi:AsmA protein
MQISMWSSTAIDLSALQQLDADIKLQSPGLVLQHLKLAETSWHLTNKKAKLKAQLKKFAAYDGTGQGVLEVNAQQTPYTLQSTMSFSNINAEPLLTDAVGVDKLLGKGNLNWQVSSKGVSQQEFISSLQGQVSTSLKDGAVRGANIAAMVRSVQEALTGNIQGVDFDKDFKKSEQTDFSEFSANFNISNGIVSNKDINLQSPLLRLTGNGSIDLNTQSIDYLLQPKLVASLEGQGNKKSNKGINLPIRMNGPWDAVKFRPDISKAAKKKVKDKVKKKVTDKAKQLLKTGG